MKYLKLIEQDIIYPYTIEKLRQDNPDTSFPSEISSDTLQEYDVFEVNDSVQPTIEEYQYLVEDNPVLINDIYYRSWTILEHTLEEYKVSKKEQVKEYQTQLFLAGWSHTYSNNEVHTLDLRTADDKANWTLLLIKTQGMISAGYGEASVNLRTANNDTITITANEAFQVMSAFLTWGEEMLRRKWDLDTEISACETLQDIAAIDIYSNWP